MIWIIGGTSEARSFINMLDGKKPYIVSVATYSGAEVLPKCNLRIQRMDQQQMLRFIADNNINVIVDMSHPYATEVTQNAKAACELANIRYIRYSRKSYEDNGAVYVESIEVCVKYLQGIDGNVFFTTGIKNIKDFERCRGSNRYIYRVLPSLFSIQECVDNEVKMQDIVAILGPVSEELNYQMFRDFNASYVVMKDSGKEGGTAEKLKACQRLGIVALIIGRQAKEDGIEDLDTLLELI